MDVDDDECDNAETNDCDLNALCSNTEGSYNCRCMTGYDGDGRNCTGNDILIKIGLSSKDRKDLISGIKPQFQCLQLQQIIPLFYCLFICTTKCSVLNILV